MPINLNLTGFCRNWVATIRETRLLLMRYMAAAARRMDALIRLSSAIRSKMSAAAPVENVVSDRLKTVWYHAHARLESGIVALSDRLLPRPQLQ